MALIVLVVLLLALLFGPGLWVRQVMKRYRQPEDRYPGSGAELARLLLDAHGLQRVDVEETPGGDHYDPAGRSRLSRWRHTRSVTRSRIIRAIRRSGCARGSSGPLHRSSGSERGY